MKNYPEMHTKLQDLMGKLGEALPETMSGFGDLHKGTIAEGALSIKIKELIALAIAITVRCDGCIAYHVNDALRSGATRAEIAEAIGVSVLMGGGPSAIYGAEALEALNQFEETFSAE